ncbi:NlpC/P60 family protein [uncultured Paracoccus sp.]|uniref:NlpC/P60 family protein n=1 Tax=uncultured Paracoccus sp. TaxID=189685 RepID=UPI0025FF050D|nr:NlpC/P60 family protein [uncultured Paracoccus sp.]
MVDDVVTLARAWIGTPYQHQASTRGVACDCLGLIRGVWRERLGTEPEAPPPYTPDWGEGGGQEVLMAAALRHLLPVPRDEVMRAGDVLLFRMREGAVAKHLGILSDAGDAPRFIHAYNAHGVIDSPLTMPWRNRIAARFRFP